MAFGMLGFNLLYEPVVSLKGWVEAVGLIVSQKISLLRAERSNFLILLNMKHGEVASLRSQ